MRAITANEMSTLRLFEIKTAIEKELGNRKKLFNKTFCVTTWGATLEVKKQMKSIVLVINLKAIHAEHYISINQGPGTGRHVAMFILDPEEIDKFLMNQ